MNINKALLHLCRNFYVPHTVPLLRFYGLHRIDNNIHEHLRKLAFIAIDRHFLRYMRFYFGNIL
ncbi:hypothetical protein SDC9_200354 [bioreactor metagenome]|uniref:Uncharacterized protein n=1 Tax=bioreactor metagenome TaxID=1076179 RepID=A0A645IPB0_9ZZZZ